MAEKRRTIYEDQAGGEWVYIRKLPARWKGEKKAAFRGLCDGTLDSEETDAVWEVDEWTLRDFDDTTLRLKKTNRTFLDEGW